MKRRNFFKYLGLAGGAAAGGAVTAASLVATTEKSEAVKEIEKLNHASLQIQQPYGKQPQSDAIYYSSGQERMRLDSNYTLHLGTTAPKEKLNVVEVSMLPGPDGELYLKTNGKWRKIVTE